jgi:hypothetical protein
MLGRDTLVVGPNLRNAFDHHLTLMLGSLQRPARRLFVAAARVGLPRLTRGGELLHVTAMRSLHGFGECGDRRFAVTQFPFALFKPGEGGTERRRHLDRRNLDHKFPSTVWDCVRIRPHVWRSHRFITAFGSEIGAVVLGPAPRSTGSTDSTSCASPSEEKVKCTRRGPRRMRSFMFMSMSMSSNCRTSRSWVQVGAFGGGPFGVR